MRHTNLSSAVRQAKELAKKKGRPHYANGSSGRYRVTDKKPEDTSFVQATPSGGEWSHKLNPATKTFNKSRIFGGVTMEDVERDWEAGTMKELISRLEESGNVEPYNPFISSDIKDVSRELTRVDNDFRANDRVKAAQGIQDVLNGLESVVFVGFGKKASREARDAISKARQAVYRLEKSLK